jgi:hypothetical protein
VDLAHVRRVGVVVAHPLQHRRDFRRGPRPEARRHRRIFRGAGTALHVAIDLGIANERRNDRMIPHRYVSFRLLKQK